MAEKYLTELKQQVDVMPYNSLYLRISLSHMKLYYNRVSRCETEIEVSEWIKKANDISDTINVLLKMCNIEKYRYTYQILKSKLFIHEIDSETEIETLLNYKTELQRIAEATNEGNKNLSNIALEVLSRYEEAIKWRKEIDI